jgi:hypothetical protein
LDYCGLRLADDPHLWASTLFDELQHLGFTGSYPSLTAAIRKLGRAWCNVPETRPECDRRRSAVYSNDRGPSGSEAGHI